MDQSGCEVSLSGFLRLTERGADGPVASVITDKLYEHTPRCRLFNRSWKAGATTTLGAKVTKSVVNSARTPAILLEMITSHPPPSLTPRQERQGIPVEVDSQVSMDFSFFSIVFFRLPYLECPA